MSGVCKYWDGGTKNAEGKLHIAEIEFNQRYGEQVAQWFELYRQHNLTYYYQILINRRESLRSIILLCYLSFVSQPSGWLAWQ
jgi:hypothetical protein